MVRLGLFPAAPAVLAAQNTNAAIPTADHGFVPRSLGWTGEIFPRGGKVSLSGTAQEIYEEIRRRNPDYDFDDMPRIGARDAPSGTPDCKAIAPVTVKGIGEQLDYLFGLGKGEKCEIKGKGCARTTCSNTAATYLCSETDKGASFPCRHLIAVHETIVDACKCKKGSSSSEEIVQGRWYSGDHKYSLWLGKANSDCEDTGRQGPLDGDKNKFETGDYCKPAGSTGTVLPAIPNDYTDSAKGKWWHNTNPPPQPTAMPYPGGNL